MDFYTEQKYEASVVEIKKQQYIADILKEIYSQGPQTIAQLAKLLHTSVPSVTVYINELIQKEWLNEVGSSITKSGRRPILFDISESSHNILVIDLNIYQTNFYLIDIKNNIQETYELEISLNAPEITQKITQIAQDFTENKKVWAVGITAPGLLNFETGINFTYPNLNIDGNSLANIVGFQLKLPTFISHDTQASMIGEYHFGLAKNMKDVLLLNLDWGIGLGILSNGNIINGTSGFAGELGHIQVKPDGKLCHCGKKGCLDTVASARALVDKAKNGLIEGKTSILSLKKGNITLEDIIEAAVKGDEFSIDLIFEIGRELGKGLSIAIHMLNPEIIILDGKLTGAGELIVSTLNQSINKFCLYDFKKELKVLISPMGEQAKLLGIKSLVFNRMMEIGNF